MRGWLGLNAGARALLGLARVRLAPVAEGTRCGARSLGGVLVLSVGLWLGAGMVAEAASCAQVRLGQPSDEYGHRVLGTEGEYKAILAAAPEGALTPMLRLAPGRVFEDVGVRCADLDGDGALEIVVVESTLEAGARILVLRQDGLRLSEYAATPPIGQRNRWRGIAAVGDLDGDGRLEIAEVDRPHLAGILRFWRLEDGGSGAALHEIAAVSGYSNHRIGQDFITAAVRDCGTGAELILPDFAWQALQAVRLRGDTVAVRSTGLPADHTGLARALDCEAS